MDRSTHAAPSIGPEVHQLLTAGVFAVLVHAVAVMAFLHHRPATPTSLPLIQTVTLLLRVPPPAPAPPPPVEPPAPQPPRSPLPHPPQRPVAAATPTGSHSPIERAPVVTAAAQAGPRMRSSDDDWIAPTAPQAADTARRAPPEYAEAVKSQVVAKVVYPPAAAFPKPKDFHGDPRLLMRQCTIPYEVLVDRDGKIVSYQIDACHDDLLDAAAADAIVKAQPFPPPPEGAEQYRIYGSINFQRPRIP